jgi:hypothetical protein
MVTDGYFCSLYSFLCLDIDFMEEAGFQTDKVFDGTGFGYA